jgi:very-short-patch-repair endonuclease
MAQYLVNSPELKKIRQQLRRESTPAEIALWNHLKQRQLNGRKFRRQFSIENCVLDFYCVEEKLNIELDGQQHFEEAGRASDTERDAFLKNLGITTLRFENKEVFKTPETVLDTIKQHFDTELVVGRNAPKQPHLLVE